MPPEPRELVFMTPPTPETKCHSRATALSSIPIPEWQQENILIHRNVEETTHRLGQVLCCLPEVGPQQNGLL